MKRIVSLLTVFILILSLAACGGGSGGSPNNSGGSTSSSPPADTAKPAGSDKPAEPVKPAESDKPAEPVKPAESNKPAVPVKPAESKTLTVTIMNSSGYIFNEIYISPTAVNDWGSDHLGSTGVLKRDGSFDITLDKYDFDTYDIKIVDEEADVYLFNYVGLTDSSTVEITFDSGLWAVIKTADGQDTFVEGELISDSSYEEPEDDVRYFDFTIYNESDYEIFAIYLMPANSDDEGFGILPDIILPGDSFEVFEEIDSAYADVTEWIMHVVDKDGDENSYYEVFDPWSVSYVDIYWDADSAGYICEFNY